MPYSLCHCGVFLHSSIRISIPCLFHACFHSKVLTLVKCNFRTDYNVGTRTILIESLKFRNKPRITVTSPSNILWKLWTWVFLNIMLWYYFSLVVFQGVANNNRTKKRARCRNSGDIVAYASMLTHRRENVKLIVTNCKDRF